MVRRHLRADNVRAVDADEASGEPLGLDRVAQLQRLDGQSRSAQAARLASAEAASGNSAALLPHGAFQFALFESKRLRRIILTERR